MIFVKVLANAERMILGPMAPRRIHAFRRSTVAKWRRALVAALMLVVGFAPAAKAVCDLEAVATQLSGAGAALEPAPSAPSPHDDDGTCCEHEPGAFIVPAKLPVADATLALALAGVHVAPPEIGFVTRTAVLGPTGRRCPPAPPEPVFRRVPRLLI